MGQKTITLSDEMSKQFELFLNNQKENIQRELAPHLKIIQPLMDKLKDIEEQLSQLGHTSTSSHLLSKSERIMPAIISDFDKTWTRAEKAMFVLRKFQKAMTMSQIITYISDKYEPGTTATIEATRQTASRYATTLKMKADAKTDIKRTVDRNGDFIYGLADWFEGDMLKKEYHPTPNQTSILTLDSLND